MLILVKFWRPSSAESGKGLTVANTLKSRRSAELSLQHRIYFTHGILCICTGKVYLEGSVSFTRAHRYRYVRGARHLGFGFTFLLMYAVSKDVDRPGRRPHIRQAAPALFVESQSSTNSYARTSMQAQRALIGF